MRWQIKFEPSAAQDYETWSKKDGRIFIKIQQLINAISVDPYKRIGKPEQLRHKLTGYWSRRIAQEHRLIYQIKDNQVIIRSCHGHYLKQ